MIVTPVQKFRSFIANDRIQESYTKEQLLEVIDMILIDAERNQIMEAYKDGHIDGHNDEMKDYYNEKFFQTIEQ
jgi:hypothetical protein